VCSNSQIKKTLNDAQTTNLCNKFPSNLMSFDVC
jgi:hypothetical protein